MDEEDTRDFRQACKQCSVINWGISDEGKFFCKSCHNVIEKTADVSSEVFMQNARVNTVSKGLKKRNKLDRGCEWYICEGFQYILNQQAKALVALGTSPLIKDEILCNIWRRYLQKNQNAYTNKPIDVFSRKRTISENSSGSSGLETNSDLSLLRGWSSFSESDPESQDSSIQLSNDAVVSDDEATSIRSGSIDGRLYRRAACRERLLMSMPLTLAFCYLALLWLRESITLADLLRFVSEHHVPYLNTFQYFPEEMKLYGPDIRIFQVQSIPSYEEIQRKMHQLAEFLNMPRFPEITEKCFLHPDILCIKYLMEANLPESMHIWTRRLVKKMGIGEMDFLTFHPLSRGAKTVMYEVQAAAVIVVALKLLFVLNDKHEWLLSNSADERNKQHSEGIKLFQFRKWYKVMRLSLDESEKEVEEQAARHLWKCEKPLFFSVKDKSVIYKRKRMIHSLKKQFVRLTSSHQTMEKRGPSSFRFIWSEGNLERPCFHGDSLEAYGDEKSKKITTVNECYWISCLKICKNKNCGHLTKSEEKKFPGSYLFVLNLFSFLLGVEFSILHQEVCQLEQRLFDVPEASKLKRKCKKTK
ncbi:TATA box-binding protein-associated factor RNA polymerase I subunit B isoform X1 [Carcharodon carcharias]|uniref:TATA box-binding protein-associated factor RNA polymerase I subunit B isoform X1 n=1 Tax=Carcharodon carcharias TaxID=13397 RepID=UPI001B7EF5BE|nr:TATA box-binding protein-associated factor RNA polymerase I subunit B isoform X1 [Carcharodon carcharias]